MRRVNMITWDLLKGQWFLKDVKPEHKGQYLNIISTDNQWNDNFCDIDKLSNPQVNFKRVKIR